MKKYLIAITCLSAMMFASCDLDINDDPNSPASGTITPDLLFPAVQNAIMATSCDIMFNYAGFYAQYFDQMPTANQFNDIANYSITETSDVYREAYRQLYARALEDIEQIKAKTTNTADIFAATAMRAFAFQLMVDNTSDTPYTEALKGSSVPQPKWDDGKTVYLGVLAELDSAQTAYDKNPELMTLKDMMFDQNMSQWLGYANALRLRMYFRMFDAGLNEYKDKIVALINKNEFFKGDAVIDIFNDQADNRSPFFASYYALGTSNHCASYPIISYMSLTNDPRIEYCFSPAKISDEYIGQIPGAKELSKGWNRGQWDNTNVSAVNYKLFDNSGVSRPAYMFTQANLQFLIAEAYLRFFNDGMAKAKSAYEAAVKSDFEAKGMGAAYDRFIAGNSVSFDKASDKLELIYMQKWAALCYMDNMEAWSEIRRTDVPATTKVAPKLIFDEGASSGYIAGNMIAPAENGLEAGGLMKRMLYPLQARNLNKNTPAPKKGSDPVWWDVD